MIKRISKIILQVSYLIAGLIVASALLVSIGRLMTPWFNEHLPDLEKLASEKLKFPIKIGEVHIGWDIYEPILYAENIDILHPVTKKVAFKIHLIKVNLNLLDSLMHWQPILQNISISGAALTVSKTPSNSFMIEELKDFPLEAEDPQNKDKIFRAILSLPTLQLSDIDIHFRLPSGNIKSITLAHLILRNADFRHHLLTNMVLHQKIPVQTRLHLTWRGDMIERRNLNGDAFLSIEGLDISEWLTSFSWQDLHLTHGIGSAKIWASFTKNQFKKIQTQFQFYDLELSSKRTQKSQTIQRLSGSLGWKHHDKTFILAGEDLLINLPDHLWPTNDFSITFDEQMNLNALQITYLNLDETHALANHLGLIPTDWEKIFLEWRPKGEIQHLALTLPEKMNEDKWALQTRGQFNHLSIQSFEGYPGVENATGTFKWNGKEGRLNLACQQTSLVINTLFKFPLFFDQLAGTIFAKRSPAGEWFFSTKKFSAQNNDVSANIDTTLTFSKNDPAKILLSADFDVKQANHIARYLPLQIFDKPLVNWLEHAFLMGEAHGGRAILEGRLMDFPFKENQGTFNISGQVKNVELLYAPGWPTIQNIQGKLTFANNAMRADVTSGSILTIPISSAHAEIATLSGKEPQILKVEGAVAGDIKNGLIFIQQSPLQKTIGKNLAKLAIQGPMELNLGLTIPLAQPENTVVLGKASFHQTTLSLPVWNLTLHQLQGAFQFTEQDFQAKDLRGLLFDEPILLNIGTETQKNQPPFLQAKVQSALSVTHLEKWLKVPLSQYASGKTSFEATLKLPSRGNTQNTELTLISDLKGIALNLPSPYNKNKDQSASFKVQLKAPSSTNTLLSNISYNKLFSAALSFQTQDQALKFIGGEVYLGEGQAKMPTSSGLSVVAQFKKLDFNTLEPYIRWYKANSAGNTFSKKNSIFRELNIKADTVQLYGQSFNQAHLIFTSLASLWQADLHSKEVEGQVTFPEDFSHLQANFQRLYLSSSNTDAPTSLNPTDIPPLNLSVTDMRYDNKQLGHVILHTENRSGGMHIQQLTVKSEVSDMSATGTWVRGRSRIEGRLTTTAATKMLKHWGVNATALVATHGQANFDLNWPGAPMDASLANLNGVLSFKLDEGRIINLGNSTEAKLGLGRLLNILSFQSLPRRLSLNFSDLFESGYSFDVMKGDYRLQNGNAFTDNMLIEGPIATVRIAGRIGLRAKDYDLKMGVSAHVTSSIPMVAAVAINPVVGVAAWAVDKLASTQTSKITTYDYRITGSWDNPNWSQMGQNFLKTHP